MATRYSGELTIRLTYRDESGDYHCTVSRAGVHVGSVDVGTPGVLSIAVDCPEAYDDTARAALAFVDHDDPDSGVSSAAAFNDAGFYVGRSKANALRSIRTIR